VRDSRVPPPGANLDAGAIAALFRDHHAELVRLALFMVGDLPTAEDVVQDVYASLHRMLTYDRQDGLVSGWVDHGKLRLLPAEHPVRGLRITAW